MDNKKNGINGFDIGLKVDKTHVGWSVVTEGMDIVKKKKQLIGVDLFNEASTNEDRRLARSARRLHQRKLDRIHFITKMFEDELNKKDPYFLVRLKESGLLEEDRTVSGNLFENKEDEQEYYKKYPTAYHLRNHMLQASDEDIRLLYLSVLHLFKNRGNFLLKDVNAQSAVSFQKTYKELRVALLDVITLSKETEVIDTLESIISAKESNRTKLAEIMELIGISSKDKDYVTVFQLILGMKADIKNLFPKQLEWYEDNTKICFNGCDDFDALKAPFELYLDIEQIGILDAIKAMYDWSKLNNILKGEKYIAGSMVKSYNKHSEDLKTLREILRYCAEQGNGHYYKEMFQTSEFHDGKVLANYCAYVGKARDVKKKRTSTCSKNDFYSYTEKMLNKILEKLGNSEDDDYVRSKINICMFDMAGGEFLPKQKSKENIYVPNVILAEELKNILTKAADKHPFLLEKNKESGLTVIETILEVFTFQIPYWVGPVNGDDKYAWAVRKQPGRVYPWNFSEKIDLVKTRRTFMDRIIGDCSILFYEKVLPDSSFFNRKMLCLDEINRIRVNGEKLPVDAKQKIFNELFLKHDKVTQKGVVTLLEQEGYVDASFDNEYTGFTKRKLNQNMGPYVKALAVYPELDIDTYETIAEYITVCKSDRKLLKTSLTSETSLDEKILDSLINVIRDSGWSEYSKKCITEVIGYGKEELVDRNLIDHLYYTQSTLAEVLGTSYNFVEKFGEINREADISLQKMVEEIVNPKVRRSFQQMVKVAKDLRNYLGKEPEHIYINVYVPANNKAMYSENRMAELMRLLKSAGEKDLLKQLKIEKNLTLRKYLYYLQKGRCLYSGQIIPYEEITGNSFNIEHILPQSKVYDHSVNNLCLVRKQLNEDKGNLYPISKEIQEEMLPFWNELAEEGFLTVKKFEALTSVNGIAMERKVESIDKLLVEHRKTAYKAAALINRIFPNSKVVFVSDTILNDLKNKLGFIYDEKINELGSAKDAYLVSVCGRIWNGIFGDSPKKYIVENPSYSLNVYNYDSDYWKATDEESKTKIETVLAKAHINQTVMSFSKESGSLYKMSLLSKEYMSTCKSAVAGRKDGYRDTQKYGGYNTLTVSHFCIVKTGDKLKLEAIPLIMLDKLKTEQDYIEYFTQKGMNDVSIVKKRVLKKTVFIINGFKYYLASLNDTSIILDSGIPFYLSQKNEEYFSKVLQFNRNAKKGYIHKSMYDVINEESNIKFLEEFLEKYQTVYKNRVNSGIEKLTGATTNFKGLTIEQQCVVLENLFGIVYRKRPIADLKLIGLSSNTGNIAVSRYISKFDSCVMIEESATGLYCKKTVLK